MPSVTLKEARCAAKRLNARSKDFKVLKAFLAQKAGFDKSPRRDDVNETYRQIGRQDQHRLLEDLIKNKTGEVE